MPSRLDPRAPRPIRAREADSQPPGHARAAHAHAEMRTYFGSADRTSAVHASSRSVGRSSNRSSTVGSSDSAEAANQSLSVTGFLSAALVLVAVPRGVAEDNVHRPLVGVCVAGGLIDDPDAVHRRVARAIANDLDADVVAPIGRAGGFDLITGRWLVQGVKGCPGEREYEARGLLATPNLFTVNAPVVATGSRSLMVRVSAVRTQM